MAPLESLETTFAALKLQWWQQSSTSVNLYSLRFGTKGLNWVVVGLAGFGSGRTFMAASGCADAYPSADIAMEVLFIYVGGTTARGS